MDEATRILARHHFVTFKSLPPRLVKYCRPEHNVALTDARIRIGTLREYQRIESLELRDEDEGHAIFEFSVDEPAWFSFDWIRHVFGINMYPDGLGPESVDRSGDGYTDQLMVHESSPDKLRAKITAHAYMWPRWKNCFVLSMSWMEEFETGSPFGQYTSSWQVKPGRHYDFFMMIRHLAISEIKKKSWYESNMKFWSRSSAVFYSPSNKIYTVTSEDQISPREVNTIVDSAMLIKPIRFRRECEYRFVLGVSVNGQEFNIPDEPIFVNPALMHHLIDKAS